MAAQADKRGAIESRIPAAGELHAGLLDWYDRKARDLPWRVRSGPAATRPDPYRVWLSEVMLQQTTVAAVVPYFEKFTTAWLTVGDLARAPQDKVLAAWAGLGYYARARNLHKCAAVVAGELGGIFPDTEEALLKLPGIGPYTAAAIAAIAFGRRAVVIDGNVERVLSRLYRVDAPLPTSKPDLRRLAEALTPERRAGDYAQAVMDLGATICRPRQPLCDQCPWSPACLAFGSGDAHEYPRRQKKKPRPIRRGTAYWIENGGRVYLRRRPEKGLLGGMLEVPSTPWLEANATDADAESAGLPGSLDWRPLPGNVRHVFTHFELQLDVRLARPTDMPADLRDGCWHPVLSVEEAGLPSVMLKVARHVRAALPPGEA